MKGKKMKGKKLILTLALMACMGGLAAQNDGFFRNNDQEETRSDGSINQMGSSTESYTTPLGSGLAVLMALGAGYAVARRKK